MQDLNFFSEYRDSSIYLDEMSEESKIYPGELHKELSLFPFENINLKSDNESDIDFNEYYIQKKIDVNNEKNLTHSNNNSDDTKNKSNEESQKLDDENIFTKLPFPQEENLESVNYKNNNFVNEYFEQKSNINVFINNEDIETKRILEKKRKIFEILYPKKFYIFTPSDDNNDVKELVQRVLNEFNNKNKNIFKKKKKKIF